MRHTKAVKKQKGCSSICAVCVCLRVCLGGWVSILCCVVVVAVVVVKGVTVQKGRRAPAATRGSWGERIPKGWVGVGRGDGSGGGEARVVNSWAALCVLWGCVE